MPYERITTSSKARYLLSGLQNSGKTTSLMTFLYGPYDYLDPEQQADALAYASNTTMVVIACPGEFGTRKALEPYMDNPNLEVYEYTAGAEDINSAEWSLHALTAFGSLYSHVLKQKPDILAIDGLHSLWDHGMNRITRGDFLQGENLEIHPVTGNPVPFRKAGFIDQAHNTFGQYVSGLYTSGVPLVIATTWEDWKGQVEDADRAGNIDARRYLWPDIPGKMATRVVGKFDGRLSAKLHAKCFHQGCKDDKANRLHFVWQFFPAGDVKGVGLKGLRLTEKMKAKPYIHQNYADLQTLLDTFHR